MSAKLNLLTSVAVAALVVSASSAFSQSITQTTINNVRANTSGNVSVGNVTGHGASVGISASGAQSAVPDTFINSIGDVSYGTIKQTTTQKPAVASDPTPEIGASGPMFFGNVTGDGAAVQKSATAAASQVSAGFINAGGSVSIGNITQQTRSTTERRIEASGEIHSGSGAGFRISGDGASVSISAAAAVSSVGVIGIGNNAGQSLGNVNIGNVTQATTANGNSQVQTNSANIAGHGNDGLKAVTGAGASASITATGAASSISVNRIAGNSSPTSTTIGNVDQSTVYKTNLSVSNTGTFLNKFDGSAGLDGGITGSGASVASGATGAISSVSVGSIDDAGATKVDIGHINQKTTAKAPNVAFGSINNTGGIDGSTTGHVSGMGASASVSATGAVSIASVSAIASAAPQPISVGNITQSTRNFYPVTNKVAGDNDTITLGNVSGAGASVSAGASGATSAVGFSSIGNTWSTATPSIITGRINQTSINHGSVTNQGSTGGSAKIAVGNISGNGASVSINVAGATSQVSVTSINDTKVASANLGNINQVSRNYGNVVNTGVITAGNVSGMGAAVTVSSVGASSVVSTSVIK